MSDAVTNAITFDLEHWHSASLLQGRVDDPTDRVHESLSLVLRLLRAHDVRATFFVVGELAAEYPELVARLADEGHEIGSHGHTHTPLFDLDREAFEREIDRSVAAIEDAIGQRPLGFRAPNFSVGPDTDWAIDVLRERGFDYDSSVFPVRTPMYGIGGVPFSPYVPRPDDPFGGVRVASGEDPRRAASPERPLASDGHSSRRTPVSPDDAALVEFPLAVFHPSFRLPIAGGFYARLLPTWLLKRGIRNLNDRGVPAMLYFHPWEFNPAVVRSDVPRHAAFVSFHSIETTTGTVNELLSTFAFDSAKSVLDGVRPRPSGRHDGDSGGRGGDSR